MDLLEIPGPRDLSVKEYGEWQQSHVTDDGLKNAFRQACDVMLDDGLDLEQRSTKIETRKFLSARESKRVVLVVS